MNRQTNRGFTLIELMIVIAIIGILAAIAIPAYQDYTIRAQVSEGLTLASNVQTAVADFYAQNGTFPAGMQGGNNNLNFTADPVGNYVSDITTNGGAITISFANPKTNAAIQAGKLSLNVWTTAAGNIAWVCGNSTMSPPGGTQVGAAATTIVNKYLPKVCQA